MFDRYSPLANWPDYLPGHRENIFALGVISLNYGQLEAMFEHVFAEVARLNEIQASALFHKLPNDKRREALIEIMNQSRLADSLKERVRYFCGGFGTCSANRHDLMHSRSGGVYTSLSRNERGIMFSKFSRAGTVLECAASLEDLTQIADDMHAYMMFGSAICGDIRIFFDCLENGDLPFFEQLPLRDRPKRPTPLRWVPRESRANPSPPESSPA